VAGGAGRPRVLVCPQEFKGSLTAVEAARAIAEGARLALGTDAPVRELPLGDGGPGTVDACLAATAAERVTAEVVGPLGRPRFASYSLLRDASGVSAVIESASACGLVLVTPEGRQPSIASTFGVGQLVADAVERGASQIVVGVGGTGTNDGGAGAALALGLRLFDIAGVPIPPGVLGLTRLARVEQDGALDLAGVTLRVAVDVTNPLLGEEGATAVYGPQEGVQDWQLPAFDAALSGWAAALERDLGIALSTLAGAGAGGGLPVGLLAAVHAGGGSGAIESGAALVGDLTDLGSAIGEADLVITGEGSVDAQTGYGKTVAYVAERAAELGRPCLAIGGVVTGRPDGILDVEVSAPAGVSVEEAMALGAAPVRAAAERLMRRWSEGQAS
jgi:glycerate kinase